MLLVCCLCAVYMLFMRWLCAVCVLVVRRKSWTKWGEIVSKPSRRHLGGISKECKRIRVKKIYNKEKPPTSQLAAFCLNERDLYDMYRYQQIILFNNF